MSSIIFEVIDLSCESSDQSFFPPKVTMITKSTTQIATVLGFPEYSGFVSKPPKRYKKLTWDGSSEHRLIWKGFGGIDHIQVAGARFDYTGASEIDSLGNYITLYEKNLSLMCDQVLPQNFYTSVPFQIGITSLVYNFLGWCGATGHQKCAPCNVPYAFFENQAVGKGDTAINDSSALWGSRQQNPNVGIGISNFVPTSSTSGSCTDSSTTTPPTFALPSFFEPVKNGVTPPPFTPSTSFTGVPEWDHNYSATLSEEYTDAEALSHAIVIVGNGATAQNFVRTTGFTSTFTNVVFTLIFSSLIVGKAYVASVDLWNPGTGITTTRQYGILASKVAQSLTDIVPFPPAGQTLQVRNPKIAFAP